MDQGANLYRADDDAVPRPGGPLVFLSHRRADKPIVRAIAGLLSALDVHYWLDEDDTDLQRADALGLVGDRGVVHAIERGVRHSTVLLGLITRQTDGSWWVPYEIGYSRAAGKDASFLVLGTDDERMRLPGYLRVAAAYWSVDELARWASSVGGHHLHTDLTRLPGSCLDDLARYVPLDPPSPSIVGLCTQGLGAIELLARSEVQPLLALSRQEFDWLPTSGGPVREIAYDLLAPLAFHQLGLPLDERESKPLEAAYQVPTLHHRAAALEPRLAYDPECAGWKSQRYRTPARTWLQGLKPDQVAGRVQQFLTTRNRKGELRLATREEFKAEFDRVLGARDEAPRRALGVLLNPLFGFSPENRPVFWRLLAVLHLLYSEIAGRAPDASLFDAATWDAATRLAASA